MENASDDCVRNRDEDLKTLLKFATDDSKTKHANPYVNKPIFRRKLIEKYSTARYNINTKRVLVKISPAGLSAENNEAPKLSHEKNSRIGNAENCLSGSPTVDSAPTARIIRRPINAEYSTKNFSSNFSPSLCLESAYKTPSAPSTPSSRSFPIPSQTPATRGVIKHNYSPNAKKRRLNSNTSAPSTNGTWKIAPKSIYNHLLDMCQSGAGADDEVKPDELKKETAKKRKICHWSKKRRKKPSWCQKTMENRSHFDPYVECLKDTVNRSDCTSAGTGGDKLGIVMYLGVNRPMFPLVYKNLRVLNDSNDEKITDFWAEFALSTLITKREDRKCKPVLVPIKDPELATLVSECVEATVVHSKVLSHVSNVTSASNANATITSEDTTSQACGKREKRHVLANNPEVELRSPALQSDAKPYKLRNKKTRKSVKTNKDESQGKRENDAIEFDKMVERNETKLEVNNDENEPELEFQVEETVRKSKAAAEKEEKAKRKLALEEIERKLKMEEIQRKLKKEEIERNSKSEEEEAKRKLALEEIKRKLKTEEIKRKLKTEEIERNSKIEEVKRKSKILEIELKSEFEGSELQSKMPENEHRSKAAAASRRKPTSKFLEYQAENFVRTKRTPTGPKSKSRRRPPTTATIRPREEEKSILKKFGYKECFVAIPKLSDTLIKYLSAGNYSNQSAELSDPTERELIEDTDEFGLIQCTRTDGVLIDYVKRNHSSVYFYKLKKMLDFQKTNNKYFVCCDYILIDRTENDRDVDILSIEEDGGEEEDGEDHKDHIKGIKPVPAFAVRSSRNPNDLFKVSKLSEFKNKSNNICWVKNHDLKLAIAADAKWLLISLGKFVSSLSHVSGCVLRYRLLFEIIYRAELSKKVICCEMTKLAKGFCADNKLAFGVYAFPGLCDKLLVGPYSHREEHQLSAFVRTDTGCPERAPIRTLDEKENFPRVDESCLSVKHISAKWWRGQKSSDLTEQYLNFFFNPSVVRCAQSADKMNLAKLIDDHPCFNYHSYEITGRENNLVLFHDRTNSIEKRVGPPAALSSIKIPATVDIVSDVDDKATTKDAPPSPTIAPPKQSRNLRKKPRMDYSQLVTDDMAIPIRAKNWNFNIVDVKSQRKRGGGGSRAAKNEAKTKTKTKRNRYHEAPQQHIMNERLRRLEFRNRRNNLASVLEARPSGSNNVQSLVSILHQAREVIAYLNTDNDRLDEEGKRLRTEQSMMMRKFLALLRSMDINSPAYKNGMNFVASWKKIKANHRNKLIELLGQNFDKFKAVKANASVSDRRVPNIIRPLQRYVPNYKRNVSENQSGGVEGDKNECRPKDEDTAQRMHSRKKKRQKLRDVFRKRNNVHQKNDEEVVVECEISEEVIGEEGTSSDRLRGACDVGEMPILISNMASGKDSNAVDPLADKDDYDDGAASSFGGRSTEPGKEPSHSLYYEHSYCSTEVQSIDLTNEPDQRIPAIPIRGRPTKRSEPTFTFLDRNRLNIIKNLQQQQQLHRQQRRNPILSRVSPNFVNPSATPSQRRRNAILVPRGASSVSSSPSPQQRKNLPIRTSSSSSSSSKSPAFQIVVRKTANETLCIDIIDNGRVFARLNIAKVDDGNATHDAAGSSRNAGGESAGATTYTKIMTIIQRFLQQMEKTSPVFTSNEANDDERSKQAKRRHVVNSLRSFISKFENRRKAGDDAGYSSSSRASNSDGTSPPYVTDNIDLDDGYSSKGSEASYDRDQDANAGRVEAETETDTDTATANVSSGSLISGGIAIENIVLDDDSDESQTRKAPQIIREDELIAEEDEHNNNDDDDEEEGDEIVCEEELIEEEEEEIVGQGITLEEMNDVVDAAMRVDEGGRFANSETPDELLPLTIPSHTQEPTARRTKTLVLPKPSSKVLFANQFTIIRSKDKFIPNIMKTPTKMAADAASASAFVSTISQPTSDHLSRIQIQPAVGTLVKLSTTSLPPTTSGVDTVSSSGVDDNNDSIIKRLWYSPVTRAESDMKILRRESNINEAGKPNNYRGEKSSNDDEDDSKRCETGNSNGETESDADVEPNDSGANRIVIKSFANHNKFQEAFLSNVDKLLNPES